MATDEGKIFITITDDRGTGNGKNGSKKNKTPKLEDLWDDFGLGKARDFLDIYAVGKVVGFIKQETLKGINAYINSIGVRTGDYIAQNNTQSALNMANYGIDLGLSVAAGAKIGGVWGAAAMAGISVLTLAANQHLEMVNIRRQIRIQNTNIQMIRQRAGLEINNGSR